MEMYQHDSANTFRFVLKGDLAKIEAQQLQCAWETAKSILNGKDIIIDVSGVTKADPAAVELLARIRESGAQITAARVPECEGLLPLLEQPPAMPRGPGRRRRWVLRLLKAFVS